MKLEIPVKVYFDDVQGMVNEIKKLQTYKLFAGDDMVLVDLDDVVAIMANHVKADKCSETPNGWIPCTPETMPKEGILVWVSMGNEVALWRRYNSDWYQDGLTSWVIPVEETEAWMPIEVPEPYQSKEDES